MKNAYRFTLERQVAPSEKRVSFVMLNPSTADAECDDPTVRRCMGFAKAWGFGSLFVVNTNPMRSTDPKACPLPSPTLLEHNDKWIHQAAWSSSLVVCAWGANVNRQHADRVRDILRRYLLNCRVAHLGFTLAGHPRHPLYLHKQTLLTTWDEI